MGLPLDIGQLDEATIAVLRSTVGSNLSCRVVSGTITLNETDPWRRLTARGLLLAAFQGASAAPESQFSFFLRPELLDPENYAMQRLTADTNLPPTLRDDQQRSRGEPRLDCILATGLESYATITRIEIFDESVKVPYADSDGDVGWHRFDTRIAFVGHVHLRGKPVGVERTFTVCTTGLDRLTLTVETASQNQASGPDDARPVPRLTLVHTPPGA